MDQYEKNMILKLAEKIQSSTVENKDAEVDQLIQEKISSHKDAPYLMTQALILQQQALVNLQKRVKQLEQDLHAAGNRKKGLFGNLFGSRPSAASSGNRHGWQDNRTDANHMSSRGAFDRGGYGSAQSEYRNEHGRRGHGSFLGSALSTAAGVAGGMALFSGLEHLLGGNSASAAESSHSELPADGSSAFSEGNNDISQQESLLDTGFGEAQNMNELSSSFDEPEINTDSFDFSDGFGDSDFGDW